MGKIKKFAEINIRKIIGGKDPIRVVEEFLLKRGFDPDKLQKDKTPDNIRWIVALSEGEELEIIVEGLKKPSETTIYMGINVLTVPLRGAGDILVTALEIADGLVGIKVSLVGHFLVLSASLVASSLSVDELEYTISLITSQQIWFRTTLAEELGLDLVPEGG